MSVVVILQPSYLPWLGYFDQLFRSDVFVFYDDVQYDKHGWRNRNRIKTQAGAAWLTVPVINRGRYGQKLFEVEIDNRLPWASKHVKSIAQNYAKAAHSGRYLPELEELLMRRWESLLELNIATIQLLCKWLGIDTKIEQASSLGISGERSERLLAICRHFQADSYLTGDAAANYLDTCLFDQAGVTVEWQSYKHPIYPQLKGEFIPYLSIIDLLLNVGEDSRNVLLGMT